MGLPASAALRVGQTAPAFSARATQAGKEFNFSLRNALQKGPVVLYFYPSAFTKGCDLGPQRANFRTPELPGDEAVNKCTRVLRCRKLPATCLCNTTRFELTR